MARGPRYASLGQWLDWQQRLHPATIELGLERVSRVLARTGWRRPDLPVVTVGGTNGKGSCVALLDAILRAHGQRTCTFTSPHLVDYRERIRIDGEKVAGEALIAAFECIGDALQGETLTFFEFNALAALLVARDAVPDVLLLEVGMGGRLDAVNVVDADVAVVVSIGLDHMEWLGPDEESIGHEKAGIFRTGRPAVFGSPQPPRSIREAARRLGAPLAVRGEDFDARPRAGADAWDFVAGGSVRWTALPRPALPGAVQLGNAATALMALDRLSGRLPPLDPGRIAAGLREVRLAGRCQRVPDRRGFEWVFDVAHNPAAARRLAESLATLPPARRTLAVCGMLGDKDVQGCAEALRGSFDAWYAADAEGARALDARELARRAAAVGVRMEPAGPIEVALARAAEAAAPGDRVVVFGSFHTVGPALAALGVPV
jgi:dihydrofolate synthase/folylpolyglutamate synthase